MAAGGATAGTIRVLVTGLAGKAGPAAGEGGAGMVWIAGGVVIVSLGAWLVVRAARDRRELRALEAAARSMLDWTPTDPDPGRPIREIQAAGTSGRTAGLRAALADLGRLLTGQIKELAKRKSNLESLIDALDEPVVATGEEERIVLCNRSAEALLGGIEPAGGIDARGGLEVPGAGASVARPSAAQPPLIGRPISSVFTQEDLLTIHGAARSGQTRRGRVRVTTSLGARVFQVSAAPVPAAWGGGVFGAVLLLRDVTELDRAEQVRADFVANASHELRTPIAAIKGAVETLMSGARDDPAMSERLLSMALSHASRLEEMTRDLLDLSRLESPQMAAVMGPVDLAALASSMRELLADTCRQRRVELAFEIDPGLSGLRSDGRLLELIVRNLLENAVKFAYEQTTVRVVARRAGDRVRLEVIDRGVGVPLHLRDRVFERYFQVDPARSGNGGAATKGTGLGLAIVKHAVRVLGGEVTLDSVYREGTTVRVEFPVPIAAAAPAPAPIERAGSRRREDPRDGGKGS